MGKNSVGDENHRVIAKRHIIKGKEEWEFQIIESEKKGRMNMEKVKEKGVPVGYLLQILKSGGDVTLPSGVRVTSEEVCDPTPSRSLRSLLLPFIILLSPLLLLLLLT